MSLHPIKIKMENQIMYFKGFHNIIRPGQVLMVINLALFKEIKVVKNTKLDMKMTVIGNACFLKTKPTHSKYVL